MAEDNGQYFILPEDSQRTSGKSAQSLNIQAAVLVADTIRSTLGPKGMDKMLVDSLGDVTVTNDGVTILKEMNIEHPTAKMIVEIAKTQENEVGDGTTTAVVIAGELLKLSEPLLKQNIHPTILTKGYRMAAKKAISVLEEISVELKEDQLEDIAMTAMTGKGAEYSKETLAKLIVKAIKSVKIGDKVDLKDIKIERLAEGSIDDSELIEGVVIDKERIHSGMPGSIEDAKIALLDAAIEVRTTEIDAKIQINTPDDMEKFILKEESILKGMVSKIKEKGAKVVFCQKGIDDIAQHFLAREGILALRRVKRSDLERLSKATGAKIVSDIEDLSLEDLGHSGKVEEVKVGDEYMTYVKDCKNPKAVTLLIKGGTEHVVSEIKRAVEDAIGDVSAALRGRFVVGGAGACEMKLSKELMAYSHKLKGREQLAVKAFAEAMEIIPRTLAENAGLDPIDVVTSLKSEQEEGNVWSGIDVFSGKVFDSFKKGIIEPLKIKTQAISSATEVAIMILRIDDVIASGRNGDEGQKPEI